MNTQEMMRILDSIARDRNVEKSLLISDLETAMVSACRKFFGTLDADEFQCSVDAITGEIQLYRYNEPMDMDPGDFGRIAAQTFKQVMIQRFRDDERQSLMEEYSSRVGTLVTGVAQRYDRGALVVQVDRAETVMLRSEQIPGEQFMPGDRVRAMILDVKDMGAQVKIYLSRGHPDFIRRLFEIEVPEVMERTIEIKAMSREAGYRTKMAVSSIDSKIDAVGACVGIRGSRIKTIVEELNGEKIDIVRWNESSQILIANALKPAEVNEISLCFELGRATVVVRDDQLSLAIGKRGQNVRLAARLTGWDVDILTPEEFTKGLTILSETLHQIEGFTDEMIDRLAALGMISVFDVEEIGEDLLMSELDFDEERSQHAVELCATRAKEVAAQQEIEKAESAARKAEEEQAASAILSGAASGDASPEVAAAAILGAAAAGADSGVENASTNEDNAVEPDEASENRAADILGGEA
ncbi:MAG: transcription termination factor NusA [Phycisphaerales bacterium]|nr:transcription termination factor NusA [Phycisphaerales bacterium]